MIQKLWPLLIGFTIWAGAFLMLYSLQALGCAWGWEPQLHRASLVAVALAGLTLLLFSLSVQLRRSKLKASTIESAGLVLSVMALPTTVITFAPTTFLSICA